MSSSETSRITVPDISESIHRSMTAERFYSAKPFAEFIESAVKLQDLWLMTNKRVEIPADFLTKLESIPGQWHIAALVEDWCLDAVTTVTPVARLCDLAINADLRVFGRDINPDLMNSHLTNGARSIPVMILYDHTWTERGWWGPRPRELQQWVMDWLSVHGKEHLKEERYRYIRGWYARDKGYSALDEMVEMIKAVY